MKTSALGRMALISHEAIVLTRYRDSKGIWTIGVGVTAAAGAAINPETFTGTLTVRRAVDLFETVLARYEADVNRAIKVPLKQHQFDALVSFHYNTGAIAKATATRLINAGRIEEGGDALLNWMQPPEVAGRRMAEHRLFETGDYGHLQAMLYPATKAGKVLWAKGQRVDLNRIDRISESVPVPSIRPEPEPIKEPKREEPQPAPTEPPTITLPEAEAALEDAPITVIEDALREQGSRTINEADRVQSASFWQRLWTALTTGVLAPVFYFLEGMPAWAKAALVFALLGLAILYFLSDRQGNAARVIKAARVDDAKQGRNLSRLDFLVAAIRGVR